jgi:hypothetical protein
MATQNPQVAEMIRKEGKLTDDVEAALKKGIEDFNAGWS